jgi:hypothetical protein
VPIGNATWKGEQARVVAVWGGDDGGARLTIAAKDPIVQIVPVSEQPIDTNLWAYLVTGRLAGHTILEAKTSRGMSFCRPLSLTVLPETASPPVLPPFAGGKPRGGDHGDRCRVPPSGAHRYAVGLRSGDC